MRILLALLFMASVALADIQQDIESATAGWQEVTAHLHMDATIHRDNHFAVERRNILRDMQHQGPTDAIKAQAVAWEIGFIAAQKK
jgi:Ni/Co efflux regulator RcnB